MTTSSGDNLVCCPSAALPPTAATHRLNESPLSAILSTQLMMRQTVGGGGLDSDGDITNSNNLIIINSHGHGLRTSARPDQAVAPTRTDGSQQPMISSIPTTDTAYTDSNGNYFHQHGEDTSAGQRSEHQYNRGVGDSQVSTRGIRNQQIAKLTQTEPAPLASLDCSITEPISEASNDNNKQSSTITTPTLSGYFDCDQLSDMVDDSLFEITNAGCLSRSIFSSSQVRNVDSDCEPPPLPAHMMTTQFDNNIGHYGPYSGDISDANAPNRTINNAGTLGNPPTADMTTPSNGQVIESNAAGELTCSSSWSSSLQGPQIHDNRQTILTSASSRSSRRQNHDTTDSAPFAGGERQTSKRQRSKSAKYSSDHTMRGGAADEHHQSRRASNSHQHRKFISQQDLSVRNESLEPQMASAAPCPICGGSLRDRPSKKKEREKKSRFTFSLFNLFTSSSSSTPSSSSNGDQKSFECRCAPPRRTRRARGGLGSSATTVASSTSKVRDSIKLTNQRKQRKSQTQNQTNSKPAASDTSTGTTTNGDARLSNSFNELNRRKQAEVLLDLAVAQSKQAVRIAGYHCQVESQSSNDSSSLATHGGRAVSQPSGLNNSARQTHHNHQHDSVSGISNSRQTKSVKFTTPDRVLILSNGSKRHTSSGHLPPIGLQPTASIIKRPVPKSSSYSQTESNKNLDEMLAKFEINNEMIAQINERLKLTDKIASPKSALDEDNENNDSDRTMPVNEDPTRRRRQVRSLDDQEDDHLKHTKSSSSFANVAGNESEQHQLDEAALAGCSGPTPDQRACDNNQGDINARADPNNNHNQPLAISTKAPIGEQPHQTSPTSGSETAPDEEQEAGFVEEWLSKEQRAMVSNE